MKAILFILTITIFCPLSAQIVFEEITPQPGGMLRDINESRTGMQCLLTDEDMFGKALAGSSWMKRNQNVSTMYDVMYSPDGDLYTKNDSFILYSQNNGETFTHIDWPNGLFPPYTYTNLFVLDDDVLFLSDNSSYCYYSLDNGQSWHWIGQLFLSWDLVVRKVGNFIYMADPSFFGEGVVSRVNVTTGQYESVDMIDLSLSRQIEIIYWQIVEDGTIYMYGQDFSGPQNIDLLLEYKFGEDLVPLGAYPNPTSAFSFFAVGPSVYDFGPSNAYVFNGQAFQPLTYIGLPQECDRWFIHADNDHVYAIVDGSRIFRSVGSLAFPGEISGRVSLDESHGCIPDSTNTGLAFWRITVEGENYFFAGSTGPNGEYKYTVPEGAYTVSAQPPGPGWDVCGDAFQVVVDTTHLNAEVDFLAQGSEECASLSLDFSTPLLRRCFDNYYTIHIRNTGPEASTGNTLVLHLDPFFEFHSASIPYQQVDDHTVSFTLGTLELNTDLTFRIYFTLSCDADLGMEHCLYGNLTADNVCNTERTLITECQTNIGSYDPNDKRAFNPQGRESEQVDKGEYITYHIRFQNTGTDTAFTVRVIDSLASHLDLTTLEMLSSSHPYTYTITDGPLLVVEFKNILLPDSTTNEVASHGFLKFRVKPLPGFEYGTSIPNSAGIYFDFNDPVKTNEVITVILPAAGTKDHQESIHFTVFPNPAQNKLNLEIPETHRDRVDSWIISDALGRIKLEDQYVDDRILNISALPPGAYTLSMISKKRIVGAQNFVKQ